MLGMSNFNRCPRPPRDKLAINIPRKGYHGYEKLIPGEIAFWREQSKRTDKVSDLLLSVQATELSKHLAARTMTVHNNPERLRRYTLGLLAQSLLSRTIYADEQMQEMHVPEELEFADADQEYQLLVSEQGFFSTQGNPLNPAHHAHGTIADEILSPYTPKENAQSGTVWYRDGDLYVKRTAPAQPSVQFQRAAVAQNPDVTFDFTQLQTLTPYLRSK